MSTKCPKCNADLSIILAGAEARKGSSKAAGELPDIAELLAAINEDELEEGAAKFVSETRSRFAQYGSRTRLSDKQIAWLQKIAEGANRKDDWG